MLLGYDLAASLLGYVSSEFEVSGSWVPTEHVQEYMQKEKPDQ